MRMLEAIALIALLMPATSATALVANGSFETTESIANPTFFPAGYGDWSGDNSSIVTGSQAGITPRSGSKMLHFIASTPGSAASTVGSEVVQLLDISSYAVEIAAGTAEVQASAFFNRVTGDNETDTGFGISLHAFSGTWPPAGGIPSAIASSEVVFASDGDIATWEGLSVALLVPPATDWLVLRVFAYENVKNDVTGTEFDGHYLDSVSARFPVCGDGLIEGLEECDDGNVEGGDCCSETCQIEPDGNPCDDANACTNQDSCRGGACIGQIPDPVVVLDEDFESFIPGTNLLGDPSWSSTPGQDAPMLVEIGTELSFPVSNQVATGRVYTFDGNSEPIKELPVALNPVAVSIIEFDAFAWSDADSQITRTHNARVGIHSVDENANVLSTLDWLAAWHSSCAPPGGLGQTGQATSSWIFQAGSAPNNCVAFTDDRGGFDEIAHGRIVVDGCKEIAYGQMFDGSGRLLFQSPEMALSSEEIAEFNVLYLHAGYSDGSHLGAEFDNITVVTASPPSVVALGGGAGIPLLAALIAGIGAVLIHKERHLTRM